MPWSLSAFPQLKHELQLIAQLNFASYFLTVYDIVRFARSRGILCQGRGSAANSAVCYYLGITAVDPGRIDMLFERFISAARGEPPDIDVDFEHERREEVLQYIYEKYGRDRAGMTAEVISYRGRSAVRDVGKALGLSLDMVDALAQKLDWWHRGTLTEPMLRELGLDPADATIRRVLDLTGQLLGFPRHLSQHVGGMVMTRGPLCELVPIENAAMENRTVIEWDKDDIDALGILKVDVLGLGMLTCLRKAMEMANGKCRMSNAECRMPDAASSIANCKSQIANYPAPPFEIQNSKFKISLSSLPPEDPAVYDMICRADTIGVFQIESRAQMSMLPRLRPRCFYDLVIEVAIVRPGPIQGNMVHPYLRRRNGEEAVSYPSEALRQVLAKTLGVPLFQEQAMRLAMVGAGFSAEEADQLRRAMAAWRKSGKLESFRQRLIDGFVRNGYSPQFAEQCYLQIRGFGEYGFPESHAASFALLVYASAWLKLYYPTEFAAALLNSQPMGFYQPAQIVRDAQAHGVEVRPVDVNASEWDCTVEKRHEGEERHQGTEAPRHQGEERHQGTSSLSALVPRSLSASSPLRLGFRLIRGLPRAAIERLVQVRQRLAAGRPGALPFSSIAAVQAHTGLSRAVLAKLAQADAFRSLGLSRRQALWQLLELDDHPAPLFDNVHDDLQLAIANPQPPPFDIQHSKFDIPFLPPMPLPQEVAADYRTTGLSLKRHPVSFVRDQLHTMRLLTAAEAGVLEQGRTAAVAGIVLIRQRPGTASGVVFITLEDETGIFNLIVRTAIYDRYRRAARHARLLAATGRIERQGQVVHLLVSRLEDLGHLLTGPAATSRDFR